MWQVGGPEEFKEVQYSTIFFQLLNSYITLLHYCVYSTSLSLCLSYPFLPTPPKIFSPTAMTSLTSAPMFTRRIKFSVWCTVMLKSMTGNL